MEHPDWLWNPLEICRMGSSPFETGSSCCGITQKGEPCKNVIRQTTLKSGRQNLDILAETPLNRANLKIQLQEIARDFLCTRWHRDRQSDSVAQKWYEAAMRNQPQAEVPPQNPSARYTRLRSNGPRLRTQHRHRSAPTVENSLNTSEGRTGDSVTAIDSADDISAQNEDDTVSETSAYRITPSTLLQGRIPWDISPSRPAILKIGDDNTGLRVLKLKSFTQHRNREQCYICHGTNDGSETDDPVTLHCGRCQFNVHLGCMQLWLGSLQSATPTTCPQCKYYGAYDAKFELGIGGSEQIIDSTGSGSENDSMRNVRRSTRQAGSSSQAQDDGLRRSARIAGRSGNTRS